MDDHKQLYAEENLYLIAEEQQGYFTTRPGNRFRIYNIQMLHILIICGLDTGSGKSGVYIDLHVILFLLIQNMSDGLFGLETDKERFLVYILSKRHRACTNFPISIHPKFKSTYPEA